MNTYASPEKLTRRGFLAAVGAASAALIARPATAALAPIARIDGPITLSAINAAIGSRFTLRLPEGSVAVALKSVEEHKSDTRLQHFTCHFSIEPKVDRQLGQQVYSLDSKALGRLNMLMLPGNEGPTTSLVSTFCQLVNA